MPIAKIPPTTKASSAPGHQAHSEDLLDEALEETFPASDSISPSRRASERAADSHATTMTGVGEQSGSVALGERSSIPTGSIALDPVAFWDARQEIFTVRVHQSPTFAELVILKDAPLPLAHLDTSAHNRKTALGSRLHTRLEAEVNAAIARGGHQVATGMFLVTPEEIRLREEVRR